MTKEAHLPELPQDFIARVQALEATYLAYADPIMQSGFGGGPERWREERIPILEAVSGDGDLLDVGCANGHLLECLVSWAAEGGIALTPHGVDIGPRLIAEVRNRLPEFADNFHVGNGWNWSPPRRYRYVYTLADCVPDGFLTAYLQRLLRLAVEPGGTLIVGDYGSRSREIPPRPIADMLRAAGFKVAGAATGGQPPVTAFAWMVLIP